MNIGDKVRFLNATGGGKVTGFRGKDIVLVEDETGFEIPCMVNEVVAVETDQYNFVHKSRKSTTKEVAPPELQDAKPTSLRAALAAHSQQQDDDAEELLKSEYLFARKFSSKYPGVIREIGTYIKKLQNK